MMPPIKEPEDLTENGACSRCGGCCASILPLSDDDIAALQKFAGEAGYAPKLPAGRDVVYLHCPFLRDDLVTGKKACACYDVRPAVCRTFLCANSNHGNALAWMRANPGKDMPGPVNAWSIFGRTGLRLGGQEVLYDKAPRCRISTADGGIYEFAVGRPVELLLTDGSRITPSMVTGLDPSGIQVFNASEQRIQDIAFHDISDVLTDACIITEPSGTPAERQEGGAHEAGQ